MENFLEGEWCHPSNLVEEDVTQLCPAPYSTRYLSQKRMEIETNKKVKIVYAGMVSVGTGTALLE